MQEGEVPNPKGLRLEGGNYFWVLCRLDGVGVNKLYETRPFSNIYTGKHKPFSRRPYAISVH